METRCSDELHVDTFAIVPQRAATEIGGCDISIVYETYITHNRHMIMRNSYNEKQSIIHC